MLVVCRSRQASDFDRRTTARLQAILPLLGHSLDVEPQQVVLGEGESADGRF
jgi:hypothetical protein